MYCIFIQLLQAGPPCNINEPLTEHQAIQIIKSTPFESIRKAAYGIFCSWFYKALASVLLLENNQCQAGVTNPEFIVP